MASYRFLVQQLCGSFEGCEFHHVPRAENEAADALSKLGSTRKSVPAGISLEHIRKPSINPSPESESIFIPAELEAPIVKAAEPTKASNQKAHLAAPGAGGSYEPTAPGAADCGPGDTIVSSGTNTVMQEASGSNHEASSAPASADAVVLVVVAAPY